MNKNALPQVAIPSFIDGVAVDPALQGVPLTKKTDQIKPLLEAQAHTKIFDLSDPDDLAHYSRIKTACKNSRAEMMHLQREWVQETNNFKVLCEWCTYELKPNTN
jgi:hypothetical protein